MKLIYLKLQSAFLVSALWMLQVVVESGNDIIFWKEFAMEASRSTSYQELGRMLVKLHSVRSSC